MLKSKKNNLEKSVLILCSTSSLTIAIELDVCFFIIEFIKAYEVILHCNGIDISIDNKLQRRRLRFALVFINNL